MSGYREGLQGPLLDFSMKRYSSHRSIPAGIIDELQSDFEKHLKKANANKSLKKQLIHFSFTEASIVFIHQQHLFDSIQTNDGQTSF